jgi:hypothetical protein
MKTVIGLAGVKTSGKSTVAEMIKELLGSEYSVLESALADKLKNVSGEVFDVPRDYFDNQDFKEVDLETPRTLSEQSIQQILNLFNVEVTEDLMQKYRNSGVIGMELKTPRKIAQIVGTEVLRATGNEDIHCENMPVNEGGITIVSDLRFPNEFEYFHKQNFLGVRFIPLHIKRDEAEAKVTPDSHPSETSLFKFCHQCVTLPNNGSLEDLRESVETILVNEGYVSKESKQA